MRVYRTRVFLIADSFWENGAILNCCLDNTWTNHSIIYSSLKVWNHKLDRVCRLWHLEKRLGLGKEGLCLGLASKPKWKVSVSSWSRGKLERSRLGLVSIKLSNVSVSKEKVSFTSLVPIVTHLRVTAFRIVCLPAHVADECIHCRQGCMTRRWCGLLSNHLGQSCPYSETRMALNCHNVTLLKSYSLTHLKLLLKTTSWMDIWTEKMPSCQTFSSWTCGQGRWK